MGMFDQNQRLMQEGEYDRAARTAEEGMRYYQEVECFLHMYARCCILDGKTGKGVRSYDEAARILTELLEAYTGLFTILTGMPGSCSWTHFSASWKRGPGSAESWIS